MVTSTAPKRQLDRAPAPAGARTEPMSNVADRRGRASTSPGRRASTSARGVVEVELVDDVGLRPGARRPRRCARCACAAVAVDGAEHPAGAGLDDRAPALARCRAGRPWSAARSRAGPVPAARPAAQQPRARRARRRSGRRRRAEDVGRSASVSGSSAAAAAQVRRRARRGCPGRARVASTGRPNSASGWCTR